MFKLQPNPTFSAKAKISIPGAEAPGEITVEFRHLGAKALKAYFAGVAGKTDAEAIGEIVVGWSGVDAVFSPGALDTLLDNYPLAASEIFTAYREAALEARTKN